MNVALLTAAGAGSRMQQEIPKQFMHIEDKPIIVWTMEVFEKHPNIDAILVVCLDGWQNVLSAYAKQFRVSKLKWIVPGGSTGQESIRIGVETLYEHCKPDDVVLVHDGNRPLISSEIISNSLAVYEQYGSAVTSIPCTEAVFNSKDGIRSDAYLIREELQRTQTPHVYSLSKLLWAHQQATSQNIINTAASCSLMYALGEPVYFSPGSERNIKITTREDIALMKALLRIDKEYD